MMEKIRFEDFMVHFNTNSHTIEFEVFPVIDWEDASDHKTGFSYVDKNGGLTDNENNIEMKFKGSYCWRGIWEGRIYFTDSEYWGEEISIMAYLYENHIEKWCKNFIKKRDPDYLYDE